MTSLYECHKFSHAGHSAHERVQEILENEESKYPQLWYDGTKEYCHCRGSTKEVDISQAYESLRAAISWSVCALHCHLGIAMCILKCIVTEQT
ncbi:hypothetical protein POJ06DRAFT_269953 [Lipomyces tetrasporus]|uniref:Uncharacterized protein n=1 Tax=Lipomyces tetrasporus TaxID=54092 RepID=A0AAD7QPG7_9ASCO|nr:uncharacterized protein POJ06DRAFT_269953 [Lipomyces tetrasporus]KAJ8098881.1 hypothetical protein POJ06DRAFT_269953 [Lipomyces tetrasporus]